MNFRIASPFKRGSDGQAVGAAAYPFLPCMLKQAVLGIAGIALFGGGILIGHLSTTKWHGTRDWLLDTGPVDAAALVKLKNELHLTPAQEARVAPVITAACTDLRLISEENKARRLELLDEISATIEPDLTADQRHRLEQYEAESRGHTSGKRDQRIVALF